ncbi:hypothetical protein FT663_04333 [Candidozyma haemuli var. vulneris]|uniref:TLC domain-containing protein n=1 Tax=Candidozyma haemuli TaxID=45357 RepID=A0A2V1AYC6_9ASCO|nr:hypothetical protein CXQ85_002592 [[Candida] haemuloni]KAF3986591.1 hypothetical protein FT662_04459 [[Candida] haemuloni var. vulneris]KAF3987766.1 hypothetical protein FT663_04333 [[Candida] haemuloni var. vulneris]PVH22868.1 hypothetical protein CXQ85_002592 [[Candida] haemuloni]
MASQYSSSWQEVIDKNQIPLSRNFLVGLHLTHFLSTRFAPNVTHYTQKFFHLQYFIERKDSQNIYDIGLDDAYYVVTWVVLLTFFRSFLMQWAFTPFAKHVCDIHSKKAKMRFAEQSWAVTYYCFSFAFGLYIYRHSPHWHSLDNIYIGWPHYRMPSLFKKYYLVSIAFWLQQIVVLNIEKKRKDHFQMFSHHIITVALVLGSYYYYYNRIGNMILMLMDSVDIFLSTAKVLKYSGWQRSCDMMFVLFLVSWVVLRHGVYNYLYYHAWVKSRDLMFDSQCIPGIVQKRCWTTTIVNVFLALLGGLQIITCLWMFAILKVLNKVIHGDSADDVRSDAEDSDEEVEVESEGERIETETPETTDEDVSEKVAQDITTRIHEVST